VASTPCSLGGDQGDLPQEFTETHEGDLAALEELALRYGFPVGDGNPKDIFREPDSVIQAHELGNSLP
jgi:hypothetical protein